MSDIVERLRAYQAYCPQTDRSDHPICTEAADAITTLREENERMRGFAETIHALWSDAEDACDNGGFVEDHIVTGVLAYTNNTLKEPYRNVLCDLVEKNGRAARAALKERVKP